MTSTTNTERFHALDAIRAFALLLGIVLHAAMSFLPGFSIVGMPIVDNSPSTTLAVIFFTIHLFRMILFFFIAGFFGHLLLMRRGVGPFIRNRLLRIAVPLLVGWPFVMALIIASMIFAAGSTPNPTPAPESAPQFEKDAFSFPLTHLWFLYVLLWMYAMMLAARSVYSLLLDRSGSNRDRIDACVRSLVTSGWCPIILAVPTCISLLCQKQWVMWFGIPTPDNSLLPNTTALIGFFTAFAFGWLVHRQVDLLTLWQRSWRWNLIIAIILTTAALALVGPAPVYKPAEKDWTTVAYAVCYTVATWYWVVGLIGAGLQLWSDHSPTMRYLADSSYWLYIIHLPVLFFAQAIVMKWNLHWSIKFPLILIVTLPLMLLSYHYLVRSSFIGAILNGRKYPRQIIAKTAPDCCS